MATKTYILCPGQGAQEPGMGKSFFDAMDAARQTFGQANRILGFDLAEICFHGPSERLNQTDISQPAIYVTSVACHRAAVAAGKINPDDASEYAGLSLGEYTALHLAGVFSFETGLRLVAARGKLMQDAATRTPSSMVAVVGGDEATVNRLCEESSAGDVLVPANFNAPGQIVVSGSKAACERFTQAATSAGLRAVPLSVAGAFHSPIMQPAADAMADELENAEMSPPSSPVWSNVTAEHHRDVESIRKLLVDQIVKPVRWEQTMAKLANLPDARFVELAPGKVLTGLLRKQNRRAAIETLESAQTLA
jgi:[acyl-carrier-protein] S-malonyltransferase